MFLWVFFCSSLYWALNLYCSSFLGNYPVTVIWSFLSVLLSILILKLLWVGFEYWIDWSFLSFTNFPFFFSFLYKREHWLYLPTWILFYFSLFVILECFFFVFCSFLKHCVFASWMQYLFFPSLKYNVIFETFFFCSLHYLDECPFLLFIIYSKMFIFQGKAKLLIGSSLCEPGLVASWHLFRDLMLSASFLNGDFFRWKSFLWSSLFFPEEEPVVLCLERW